MELEGFYAKAGERVGPYRLLGPLGRGGMGAVYRAEAAESCPVPAGKVVALKLLYRVSADERRRAQREVAYLQALAHPGIVRVLDFGEHEGRPFLVMPVIEGRRFDRILAEDGTFSEERAARLAIGALEALHVAHLAGILHRDVKPGNLIERSDGQVVVLDFGLAAAPARDSRLTRSDAVLGTPAYMSPEQAAGDRRQLSPRSDVYAMGAVLYELLCGVPPFHADNPHALLRLVIEGDLVPPRRVRESLSHGMEIILLRALAREPQDRYRSAEAMAADLRRLCDGEPIRATRPGRIRPLLRQCWRRRRTIATAGLVLFVLVSLVALAVRAGLQRRDPATAAVDLPTWAYALVQGEPLGAANGLVAHPSLGHLATLPTVSGPVRLAATITPLATEFQVELLVADRDIGAGYAARLIGQGGSLAVELHRQGKALSAGVGAAAAPGEALRLTIESREGILEARLARAGHDPLVLPFFDVIPLEGPEASGCYIVLDPARAQVSEITLERTRSGVQVSGLVPADTLRQDGRFERALAMYDAFRADHPDSPLARDALLRAGLCLEELGRHELALDYFNQVIQANRHDPRYLLVATFHAWACQLRLGRRDDAESSFIALRRDYPVEQLLAHIPAEAPQQLLDDYFSRALKLAPADPVRARDLYLSAVDIATYLKQNERAAEARASAGDLLRGFGDLIGAEGLYRINAEDSQLADHLRAKARLKLAETLRLDGRSQESIEQYHQLLSHAALGPVANLWLGDLLNELGDDGGATACWEQAALDQGLSGTYARALLRRTTISRTDVTDPWYANDTAFMLARIAQQEGDQPAAIEHLRRAAQAPVAGDWPSPLAESLLRDLEYGP
jgi:tetratricopeptide (TPR) repeat protein